MIAVSIDKRLRTYSDNTITIYDENLLLYVKNAHTKSLKRYYYGDIYILVSMLNLCFVHHYYLKGEREKEQNENYSGKNDMH